MKTDIYMDSGIRIDPKVVKKYTNAGRKREPRTDDCMGNGSGELWEEFEVRKPPVWQGCTAVLPNGKKCYNAPLGKGGNLCYAHSIKF